ncbi:UNVERIFIED_CONTAM: hypothetical protein PYX00_004051 [Menopon gallinae]
MDMSLYDMMKNRKRPMPEIRVKRYMYQLLKGLDHLHHHGLFHRDIKPENILIKNEVIKIADLGSIRGAYSRPPYTEYISTRWYRSPECLLTTGFYGPKMDVWACGCVFFELLTTKPLFPGTNEVDQISKIHDILGTPHTRLLAKFHRHKSRNCEYFFQSKTGTGLSCLVPNLSEHGRDILKQMLTYDPEHRSNVRRLLEHRYFNDLRDQEMLTIKKSNIVTSNITKEWRNPLLLSHIMSGEKKKKSKLLKKRFSPQKSGKETMSTSTQSLTTNGNFMTGSTKTLPLLHHANGDRPLHQGKTLDCFNGGKVEKRMFNSEEQITPKRTWCQNSSYGKVINEQKIETRPMKRKTSPQLPKVLLQAQQNQLGLSSMPNCDAQPKEGSNFGNVTLPNMDLRRSEFSGLRKLHHSGPLASYRNTNHLSLLSTIPERIQKKALDVRLSPADSSSAEGVVKKPRGNH